MAAARETVGVALDALQSDPQADVSAEMAAIPLDPVVIERELWRLGRSAQYERRLGAVRLSGADCDPGVATGTGGTAG